tara:strand:- start:158 stop:355 length:198 start_codon:yes stop_codon:yes gene_type:complete
MTDCSILLRLTPNEETNLIKDNLYDNMPVFKGFLPMFGTTGSGITFGGGGESKDKNGSGKNSKAP